LTKLPLPIFVLKAISNRFPRNLLKEDEKITRKSKNSPIQNTFQIVHRRQCFDVDLSSILTGISGTTEPFCSNRIATNTATLSILCQHPYQ
jgi:hypothetical protein